MESESTQRGQIKYNFRKDITINFGESLYIAGETPELGDWNPLRAPRMICINSQHWVARIPVVLNRIIEYKYFIAPYDLTADNSHQIEWLGTQNSRLYIPNYQAKFFDQENINSLRIMSFNVRYECKEDKGNCSWVYRRQNCIGLIYEQYPDIIGVQEPKKQQKDYLCTQLRKFYDYYGRPRDLYEDEESGIFIRRDKYIVVEDGYVWFNERRIPGQCGFDSCFPRYATYLIVQPIDFRGRDTSDKLVMFVNTHFDHKGTLSREKGVQIISELFNQKKKKHKDNLQDFFLGGDFNTPEQDPIFEKLRLRGEKLSSIRTILPAEKVDFSPTFNGFVQQNLEKKPTVSIFLNPLLTIDHLFLKIKNYQPSYFATIRKNKVVSDHNPILAVFRKKEL